MSKGQKIIAEFIINSYDKAAFMTAATLGANLNVSESTVVRFANTLGYSGYRELQKELQELIKNKLTTVQRLNLPDGISKGDNNLAKVMESDIDNIKKTITEIDINSLNRAVKLMTEGKQIYVIGLRSSSFLAGYLCFYLNFLFSNVKLITAGANDVFEQLVKADEKDLIIGITFPRYSKKTLEALDYSKGKGCSIITITDSLISPAASKSDVTLIARSDMISFIDSLVAPMSLINAFIIALGVAKKNDLSSYFEDLEKIWQEYNVYDENNIES
jgi:DNA-binding MurR/RpiR family transcriptional regulator